MSYFRSLSATLLSAVTTFSVVTASCGTTAVGIDECRDIEDAACDGAKPCGITDDVAACKRYYRDHCLHGLSVRVPVGASVSGCVQVIEAAGQCAQNGADTLLSDCDPRVTDPIPPRLTKACDVVKSPELATECSFLTETPLEGTAGQSAGGQSGSDSSDSSAGQGGASGATAE